jgi:alpha-2-macroglobulin
VKLMWLRPIRAWLLAPLLLVTACGDSGNVPDVGPQDPLWEPVIAQHSRGEISRRDPIRIVFTRDVADDEQIGSSASEALSVRPSIEGSVTFTSASEIMIVPAEELGPGTAYVVTVHASGLRRVSPELDRYQFVVRVMEQGLDVAVGGLSPDPDDGARLVLTGRVTTADVDEPERVEGLVRARFRGQDLAVRWNHDFSGRGHDFTVEGIARGDSEETLTLAWDGAPLGVETSETREVTVPAVGVFAVTRVVAVQGERQYVLVEFSDPLDDGQNLTGLLSLGGADFTSGVEGNQIRVYPAEVVSGDVSVVLQPGIRSAVGTRLEQMREASITFAQTKPGVRFAGTGNILPRMDPLTVPIEAVNVHSVQLTAFAVEDVKMGQFLQTNALDGEGELGRVGRYLWRRTLPLASPIADQWNRYLLDVSDLMGDQEWGMVRLALSIHRGNSTYACSEEDLAVPVMREAPLADVEDFSYQAMRGWSGMESQYDPTVSVSFEDRDDPCRDAYYRFSGQTTAGRNYIASNLGILAKRDELGFTLVTTTSLETSEPEPGVEVTFMSFQDRPITTVTTGPDGMARLELEATPFYALAEKGDDRGYLRMSAGGALSTSHFDVGGVAVTGGLKGFVYGERGVWRPGDTLHLTFVSQHDGEMPESHPATMQVFNPRGQLVRSITNTTPTNGFYPFRFATDSEAPTGAWSAAVSVGGSRFTKALTIETVVPNRLRVDLDAGGASRLFGDEEIEFGLFGQWLSGAIARELRADVEVRLRPLTTRFETFPGYGFDDPARSFSGEAQRIFEGELDESGRASFAATITPSGDPAGFVSAAFTSRVFERGGAFSTSRSAIPYSPYTRYVGVRVPEGSRRGMLVTDTTHMIDVATVDAEGAPLAVSDLRVTVYKMQWRWWWDRSGESMAQYATSEHRAVVDSGTVATTADGRASWPLRIDYPQWGRYLIRVCDAGGGHCSGQVFYMDWPGWAGRPQQQSGVGASVLSLAADAEEYSVGQVARIELPEAEQGRALVTVENGSRILDARWVELTEGRNRFEVPITDAMAPTAYLSVTLIQPHAGRDNDRPLRLYGVIPLAVSDPATRLTPVIQVAEEWRPDRQVPVRVSEASGRPMTYTLAVVDEGLLDLTNFQTPDLHAHFYQKERLGVRTWDVFDHVVGAYGGALERLLALGGGDAEDVEETEPSRYPPVVRYHGPFDLAPGATDEHQVDLPQYIGAVRVMVVAGRDGAYGRADESVFVREPLSLLATLPRVVGPEEEITLPVSLFAMTEDVREATVRVETDELFEVVGSPSETVAFSAPGEEMAFLRLRVGSELGTGRILVTATSGEHNTRSEIFLTVRSPNPMTVRQQVSEIAPGERWAPQVVPHGLPGTNRSVLEVTTLPPLNLETRLRHLTRAPYGNIEHMVSSVFPQLWLPGLIRMDQERRDSVDARIRTVTDRIRGYQLPDGSMSYWPGGMASGAYDAQASWTTNYVGHFLIEAEKRGYYVAPTMKSAWVDHQRATAQAWRVGGEVPAMDHAYRLYTLALAGRADMGAMNRLRASDERGYVSSWYLAAAYGLAGLRDVGLEVARQAERQVPEYGRPGWSFGSRFRDLAVRLTALVALEMDAEAEEVAREISAALYSNRWLSSHTIAYALLAMAQMYDVDGSGGGFAFGFGQDGATAREVASPTPVYTSELVGLDDTGEAIEVVNTTDRTLYASVMSEGMPATGDEIAAAEGLSIDVRYLTPQGTPVNERSLVQGTDLMVRVTVSNPSPTRLDNLALEHRMPAGWEILNARLTDEGQAPFQHQDVRDDRIFTYFSLDAGRSQTFTTLLNASYLGTYHLPTVSVEAMYDGTKYARTAGYRIAVTEPVR